MAPQSRLRELPFRSAMDPVDDEFRSEIAAVLQQNPAPDFSRHTLGEAVRTGMDWHARLASLGYPVPACPSEYGGAGRSLAQQLIQAEEMAAVGASFSVNIAGASMVVPLLLSLGTEEQRQRWIPPIVHGKELWSQLFSEPGAGSDLFALRTRAARHGEYFRINGHKIWNSWATIADYGLLLARTDPESRGKRGISCLLVDLRAPGVRVEGIRQMNGCSEFAEVFFVDVDVPVQNLVGEVDRGAVAALRVLAAERSGLTMAFYATVAAEFRQLLEQVAADRIERHADAVADMWMNLAAQRLSAIRMASGSTDPSALLGVAAAGKMGVGKLTVQLAHLRAELLGTRIAIHRESDELAVSMAERFTGAMALSLGGGTHEVQRNAIAEQVLGMPR